MTLHFQNKKMEKILCNERLLYRKFEKQHADKIKNRLTELEAADNLSEIPQIPPPRRHKLSGQYNDCWGIDYSKNFRMVIKPFGTYNIDDLKTVEEVTILTLEDYH